MRERRIADVTIRVLSVIAGTVLLLAGPTPATRAGETTEATAGPGRAEVDRALRRILRDTPPLQERLEAARVVLAAPGVADVEAVVHAGLSLLEAAPETAVWLLLTARDHAFWPDDLAETARSRVRERMVAHAGERERGGHPPPAEGQAHGEHLEAAGWIVGARPPTPGPGRMAETPLPPAVGAALERDVPPGAVDPGPTLSALDRAERDDPRTMHDGLEQLLAAGAKAVPILIHAVDQALPEGREGRVPRAARAILALGSLGDRRATPILLRALDAKSGWLQVAAATALGDLGDPAAAIALCHKLAYRGEVLRPRDQWDFPGENETTVAPADWPTVEYYVVDCAAADALLRLGIPRAAGYLIQEKLDPRKRNFRIRVLQDALDALRRSLPESAPVGRFNVDAGLPQRREAFEELSDWWQEHRHDPALVGRAFAVRDEGYRREARRMVERLRGRSIMELQISQESCAILGPAATPTLVETLEVAKNVVLRTEIARALGVVDDPHAVPALLGLLGEGTVFVRATATESLGAYVDGRPEVQRALIGCLDDASPAVRVAALKALVSAPPSDEVRAAVRAHDAESHRDTFGADDREYRMAETVVRLVQEGVEHWPPIARGLESDERYERLAWWDLLRRALDLGGHVYDGVADPSSPAWRRLDDQLVLGVLARRRVR